MIEVIIQYFWVCEWISNNTFCCKSSNILPEKLCTPTISRQSYFIPRQQSTFIHLLLNKFIKFLFVFNQTNEKSKSPSKTTYILISNKLPGKSLSHLLIAMTMKYINNFFKRRNDFLFLKYWYILTLFMGVLRKTIGNLYGSVTKNESLIPIHWISNR